jgi:hypothetical protein
MQFLQTCIFVPKHDSLVCPSAAHPLFLPSDNWQYCIALRICKLLTLTATAKCLPVQQITSHMTAVSNSYKEINFAFNKSNISVEVLFWSQ